MILIPSKSLEDAFGHVDGASSEWFAAGESVNRQAAFLSK